MQTYWQWLVAGSLHVNAAFQLDQLSVLMALIVTGVGFLIHLFSVGYMGDDPGYARYFAYLNLFVFFMLVLVLGANFPLMFVGWEGVGLCSYLLIGFWFTDQAKADAGKKAFIVNRIGDVGFMIAMFMLYANVGTLDFVRIFAAGARHVRVRRRGHHRAHAVPVPGRGRQERADSPVCVAARRHGRTHTGECADPRGYHGHRRRLPGRPAGVLFALAPVSGTVVATVGALTALFAATIGLAQYDIKKVLAYSTVSQLGYMFVGVGVGAYAAGIFHLMTHAFFKALLFLGSGAVIHAMHSALHHTHSHADAQDMRNMGGLRRYLPITWACMWVATLAISGVWPFAGFFSKDEIIWQVGARATGAQGFWFRLDWLMALLAALLTAFYMTRLMVMTFHGSNRTGEAERKHLHEVPRVMWVPLVVLALLSTVGGWINVPESISQAPVLGWLPSSEWLLEWLSPVTAHADNIALTHLPRPLEQAPVGGGEGVWAR